MSDDAEFGPGGYLPQRAATRARKIVLREQMGFGWPLAAIAASLLVVAAGVFYVVSTNRPPAEPFVEVAPLAAVPVGGGASLSAGGEEVFVLRADGLMRAFATPAGETLRWCEDSRQIESAQGQVWAPDGRQIGDGNASLAPLRSTVFKGVIYVDPTQPLPAPPPRPQGSAPAC